KEDRDGGGSMFKVVWENEGEAQAYALYRIRQKWDYMTGLTQHTLWVYEALATSPQAHRELWRYIFGIDLVQSVTGYFMPADDPLPLMLLEPRHLRMRVNDALWLRVIDLAPALEARSYATDGTITFELTDGFCEWNEGTWTLTAADGKATLAEATGGPELSFDAGDLGSAYLGGTAFARLAAAGRVTELVPGAVERADALFQTSLHPWCPEIF
ncbi:MAG: sterol carrier protein domain-containing protein, partial [Actinomycetota bacterium]